MEENEISGPLLPSDSDSEEPLENSPIEQVALTVPITDDPDAPVVTARMWILGSASCILLSFLNQFFWYRKEPLSITSISAQIAVVPLARMMANCLPRRTFFPGSTRFSFSLNPGPFTVKEHVLITIFANAGAGSVYAIHVVTAVRVFYRQTISFFVSLLVVLTTQVHHFSFSLFFSSPSSDPSLRPQVYDYIGGGGGGGAW